MMVMVVLRDRMRWLLCALCMLENLLWFDCARELIFSFLSKYLAECWVLTQEYIACVCVLYSVSRKMENWTGWMYYIWWLREDILLCTKIAVQSGYSLLNFSINSIFFWCWPAWSTKMSFVHIFRFYCCEVWYRCNSTNIDVSMKNATSMIRNYEFKISRLFLLVMYMLSIYIFFYDIISSLSVWIISFYFTYPFEDLMLPVKTMSTVLLLLKLFN